MSTSKSERPHLRREAGSPRSSRARGIRLRDSKTGETMLITVEDGQLSVAPYRKAEPK